VSLHGKVSIVIPCFNQGPMLLETLASVERARTDSLSEVIVVNDGSTDPATCRIFQELDPSKYTIIHQQNGGLGRARNEGIRIARGEFILPVDSDNFIRRAYLDKGIAILLERPDAGVVYGDPEFFGEETGRRRIPEFDWSALAKMNYIDACAVYRRVVWESVGGYDEKMPIMGFEDWDFWMRVALQGWAFVHLDEIAFDYRVRSGSMLSETKRHKKALLHYIFEKPGYELLKALRDQAVRLDEISCNFQSVDYRIGNTIMRPLRKVKRIPSSIRRQLWSRVPSRGPR